MIVDVIPLNHTMRQMESRPISLDAKTWKMIDAMCEVREQSASELFGALLAMVAGFENISSEFNAPVKNVHLGDGSIIEGDKVGGNVDRSQGKIVNTDATIHGDQTNTVTTRIYCSTFLLQIEKDNQYEVVLDKTSTNLRINPSGETQ